MNVTSASGKSTVVGMLKPVYLHTYINDRILKPVYLHTYIYDRMLKPVYLLTHLCDMNLFNVRHLFFT